ncbi:MAG TPA: flavodoxin domain-containing protein, partial [Reyranella sp.]|nr:flavodoxin domain-containing protein [Reyranella sp.]
MSKILILVGTESGNAQMVADALKPVLEGAGHIVDVSDTAASAGDLEAHDVLLVVCATHGSGDVPTNILPLAETLERERPDLSGHRYGIIALGDMTYQDTFCGGGKKVDK